MNEQASTKEATVERPEDCRSGSPLCYVAFADDLAKKNSDSLSFIPRPKLERYAQRGQILMAFENDEPCGFLIHGSGSNTMKVYQACIQYDARRWQHGLALVEQLKSKSVSRGCHAVLLRCAADLEANAFWTAAGFDLVAVVPGGERRGRIINVYRCNLPVPCLFAA